MQKYFREILVFQAIVWLILWFLSAYIAHLLTIVMVPVLISILLISLIAEKIEKSRIGIHYFWLMILSAIIPAIIYVIIMASQGWNMEWLQE